MSMLSDNQGTAPNRAPPRADFARPTPHKRLFRTRFTTEGMSAEERLWAYQVTAGPSVRTTALTAELHATIETYQLAYLMLLIAECSPRRTVRDLELITGDQLGHIGVQLTLSGTSTGQADGLPVSVGPGDLLFLDGARPYDFSDTSDRHCVILVFPRVMVAAQGVDIDGVHGLVIGPGENALFSDHLRSLLPLLPTLPYPAGPRLARVLLELLTVIVPTATLPPSPALGRKASQHEALAERAYDWIEQNLAADNLSPDAIAEALRVSRSRLYQVFMGYGGIATYVLFRRLANVHDALKNPRETRGIAELAHECGFQSEAHFSRAFKASYGLTASEFRRRGIP